MKKIYDWTNSEVGKPITNILAFILILVVPNMGILNENPALWHLLSVPLTGALFATVVARAELWGSRHKALVLGWTALVCMFYGAVALFA